MCVCVFHCVRDHVCVCTEGGNSKQVLRMGYGGANQFWEKREQEITEKGQRVGHVMDLFGERFTEGTRNPEISDGQSELRNRGQTEKMSR